MQSGATIKRSIKLIEEHANAYLDEALELTKQVCRDEDAFNLVVAHLTATFRTFEAHKKTSTLMACGGPNKTPTPSVIEAADQKFAEVRDLVMQRLQIEKYLAQVCIHLDSFLTVSVWKLPHQFIKLASI